MTEETMKKLTRDEIKALENHATVHVKLSRLRPEKPELIYEGPAMLYVQRHPKTGETVTMTIADAWNWAEYDPRRDFEYNDALVNEDYEMELFDARS